MNEPVVRGVQTYTVAFVRMDAQSDTKIHGRTEFQVVGISEVTRIRAQIYEDEFVTIMDKGNVLHILRMCEYRYVQIKENI